MAFVFVFCAMCSRVNCLDPTHLVTWLLVNLPHLCIPHYPPHLLPIYSPCVCNPVPVRHHMYPVQPCQAWLPACFHLRGSFCLFVCLFYFIILLIKSPFSCTTESSLHPFTPQPWQHVLQFFLYICCFNKVAYIKKNCFHTVYGCNKCTTIFI